MKEVKNNIKKKKIQLYYIIILDYLFFYLSINIFSICNHENLSKI